MRRENYESGPRRGWIAVFVVLLAVLLAFFVGRSTAPQPDSHQPDVGGPSNEPADSERDESAAVRAAATYSRIMTGPSEANESYLEEVMSIAAPDWRARAQELADNSIDFVSERYGEGGSIEFQPIKYRVDSFSSQSAVVELWGVVLASGPNLRGIEESWVTATIELEWVDSEWKVNGQSSLGGPTPELIRTDEERTADEVLTDFKELSDAEG